jgi:hypothetical protein
MKKKHILFGIASILLIDYLIARINKTPKITYKEKLPFNYNAQTLPPFDIKVQSEDRDNQLLIQHELVHWQQYRKTGAIIYYLKYTLQKAIFGYDKMPMEVEARKQIGESEYCQNNYTECVRNGKSITIKEQNFRV